MTQEQPLLPFERDDHTDAIQLVQQQGQNEQMLGSYIEQIKMITAKLEELQIQRAQWERELIVSGGKNHQLISRLYEIVEDIVVWERKYQDVYAKARELSTTMKITSDQIKILLQNPKIDN
jgi:hypothetical protein